MKAPFPSPTKVYHNNTYAALSPLRPELSAKGKTIIITGGGTGIGAETARCFAQAGAARIALVGRRLQPLHDTKASIESLYPSVEVFTASVDVTDSNAVNAAFETFANGGQLHVLVSNAGWTGSQASAATIDSSDFLKIVNVNLGGALHVAQAFFKHCVEDATIIEVNSNAAHLHYGPGFVGYSVGKLAVVRLFDSIAHAFPKMNVFHTQPGVVDTDMNRETGGVEALGWEDHGSSIPD
jgi:NAD(P)-dependent dehydrogenase (short-subunit alcohol dehydrogenase family)